LLVVSDRNTGLAEWRQEQIKGFPRPGRVRTYDQIQPWHFERQRGAHSWRIAAPPVSQDTGMITARSTAPDSFGMPK